MPLCRNLKTNHRGKKREYKIWIYYFYEEYAIHGVILEMFLYWKHGNFFHIEKIIKTCFNLGVRDSSGDYRYTPVLKMINVAYTKLDPQNFNGWSFVLERESMIK